MLFQVKRVPAFGLDIGDHSIKLIGLLPQGDKYSITTHNSISLPAGYFQQGKILNEEGIIAKIHELITSAHGQKLRTKFVHSCLPDTQTFIKLITIPEMTEKEIPEAVKWASEHHIPLPQNDAYLDWQVVRHNEEKKQIDVLIGAAPKIVSDSYTQLLKKSGLIPLALEIEATATTRALLDEHNQELQGASVALIDMGATRTGLTVYAEGSIQFTTSLPISGKAITETIKNKLDLSHEQAEQSKIVCGFDNDACEGALRTILDSTLDELVERIQTAFAFYHKNFEESNEVSKLVLCGGGAHFGGIDTVLSEKLQLPVTIGDALTHCSTKGSALPTEQLLSYTTAIGLALRVYE